MNHCENPVPSTFASTSPLPRFILLKCSCIFCRCASACLISAGYLSLWGATFIVRIVYNRYTTSGVPLTSIFSFSSSVGPYNCVYANAPIVDTASSDENVNTVALILNLGAIFPWSTSMQAFTPPKCATHRPTFNPLQNLPACRSKYCGPSTTEVVPTSLVQSSSTKPRALSSYVAGQPEK
jgi:hypothetical protein